MPHRIVSVYFPDETLIDNIERELLNSNSFSNFIVVAAQEKLARYKGATDALSNVSKQTQKNDNK